MDEQRNDSKGRSRFKEMLAENPVISTGLDSQRLPNIVNEFLEYLSAKLKEGVSLSFQPVGHLVVAEVKSRELKGITGDITQIQKRMTARMRKTPAHPYIKKDQQVLELSMALDVEVYIAEAIRDVWVKFLAEVSDDSTEIRLRGFGAFLKRKKRTNTQPVMFKPYDKLISEMNSYQQ